MMSASLRYEQDLPFRTCKYVYVWEKEKTHSIFLKKYNMKLIFVCVQTIFSIHTDNSALQVSLSWLYDTMPLDMYTAGSCARMTNWQDLHISWATLLVSVETWTSWRWYGSGHQPLFMQALKNFIHRREGYIWSNKLSRSRYSFADWPAAVCNE